MEETGWKPIDTAPRDGTGIILYSDGECAPPVIAQWDDMWTDGAWIVQHGSASIRLSWVFNPTHWMPLPTPPHPIKDTTK
jgi:hypothetical protein